MIIYLPNWLNNEQAEIVNQRGQETDYAGQKAEDNHHQV